MINLKDLRTLFNAKCGGKIRQSMLGPNTRTKPNHDEKKRHGHRISQPNHAGSGLLKASEEEYLLGLAKWVSDSHPIHGEKSLNKKEWCMTFGEGGNHYCRIKCLGTTFPAALM